jgi:hypothetical protein
VTGADVDQVYEIPEDIEDGQLVCRDEQQTYVADALWPAERPDTDMHKVGECTDPELPLFVAADRLRGERMMTEVVWVKTGMDQYLRLRPGEQQEQQEPQQRRQQ